MNMWLIFAFALFLALVPAVLLVSRAKTMDRVIASEFAGVVLVLALWSLALGFGRPSFMDLALATAVLALPSGLLYAQFFEKWL